MPMLSKPSGAAPASVFFITIGALMDVWAGVWWWFIPPSSSLGWFLLMGLLLSGVVLLVVGLLIGRIGRAARHAEMPPPEVTTAMAQAEVDNSAPAVVKTKPGEIPSTPSFVVQR